MGHWLVSTLILAGCVDVDAVTYEIEVALPDGATIAIDGTPAPTREVRALRFGTLDELRAWSAIASVQTTDSAFQVEMRATDSYLGCFSPGRVTLIHEVWELNIGQSGGPLMFWTGRGRAEFDGKPACTWIY